MTDLDPKMRKRVLDYAIAAFPRNVRDIDIACEAFPDEPYFTEDDAYYILSSLEKEGLVVYVCQGFFSTSWRLAHPLIALAAQAE